MLGFGFPELFVIFILLLGLASTVIWVLCLVEIIKSEYPGNNKVVWLVLVILLPLIGMVVYYVVGRGQRIEGGVARTSIDRFCKSCGVRMSATASFCSECGTSLAQ